MVRVVLSVVIQNGLNGEVAHVKGKVHLRTGHEGPEEEYKFSSIPSLTSALDSSGWSTPCLSCVIPGKET